MSRHWSCSVVDILSSKSGDLKVLADMAGSDWRTLYRGQSLAGCDLSGQDLRGIDLTDCDVDLAKLDQYTLIDQAFDPRPNFEDAYIEFRVPAEIARIVHVFAREASYIYVAWAYKNLIDRFVRLRRSKRLGSLLHQISASPEFQKLVLKNFKGRLVRRDVLLNRWQIEELSEAASDFEQYNLGALAIFSAALAAKNYGSKKKDLSSLSTRAIWPD